LFKKESALERRKRQVARELELLNDDIRTLRKCVQKKPERLGNVRLKSSEVRAPEPPRPAPARPAAAVEARVAEPVPVEPPASVAPAARHEPPSRAPAVGGEWTRFRSERLTEYLAGSVQTMQPLRHERHIQRNKAIFMLTIVALALFWVLYRLFVM
jgi:hypothetical protein